MRPRSDAAIPGGPVFRPSFLSGRLLSWVAIVFLAGIPTGEGAEAAGEGEAAIQFDVFVGYDHASSRGIARQGDWFPVTFEIYHEGETFVGTIELEAQSARSAQSREVEVELPSRTRKRLTIPAFASTYGIQYWEARLLGEEGTVRAERGGIQTMALPWETPLIGALPERYSSRPSLPEVSAQADRRQPRVVPFQAALFPDTPVALSGLDALYLNAREGLQLNADQIDAVGRWVSSGGHLVVAAESPGDIEGMPWLQERLPCRVDGVGSVETSRRPAEWIAEDPSGVAGVTKPAWGGGLSEAASPELAADEGFLGQKLPILEVAAIDGKSVLELDSHPVVIRGPEGHGTVTLIAFNPEREPFLSWAHREAFFAKVLGIPRAWFEVEEFQSSRMTPTDGLLGAILDSRQVRKLPVGWLLALLLIYLIVIGPADQYVLRRLRRQMLTWVTFPLYVVIFAGLIYWIGYRLRAGVTEWNEWHVVDLPAQSVEDHWRGWSYGSIYSPENADYRVVCRQLSATARGEFRRSSQGEGESGQVRVRQKPEGVEAELSVPVWTSRLLMSEWRRDAQAPVAASVTSQGERLQIALKNSLERPCREVHLVFEGRLYSLGQLPASETKEVTLPVEGEGKALERVVRSRTGEAVNAIQQRQRALGDAEAGRLPRRPIHLIAASFSGVTAPDRPRRPRGPRGRGWRRTEGLQAANGFDLTPLIERGDAILFAWVEDYAPIPTLAEFQPRRSNRYTLFRLALPVGSQASSSATAMSRPRPTPTE